jgi:hypothetical protein
MRYTTHGGVFFFEGRLSGGRRLGPISVQVGGMFQHAQLRTLDDVKKAMATRVLEAGGNAVVGFTYGQQSVGFWKSLLHLDDVCWYGKGDIAVISQAELARDA